MIGRKYRVEPMEVSMVHSVCQLSESVATSDPGCRGSVCWSEIYRKVRSVLGQLQMVSCKVMTIENDNNSK